MHVVEVSEREAAALVRVLVARNENRFLEFKRVSGKMVHKAIETICAFANADGGNLVLGLADIKEFQGQARLFGVEENPEALDELKRKLLTEIQPALVDIRVQRLATNLHNGSAKGQQGHLVMISVARSQQVHSVANGGTYIRMDAGNRMMSAPEVTELSYRRGERSATSEPVSVALDRLKTTAWQRYLQGRGALTGSFEDQLLRIGLANDVSGTVTPLCAAVLLFADEPGSLLAAHNSRADVRVMV